MPEQNFTASQMFRNANRFIEAYHAALQPVCRDTGLPPMAVDILMFCRQQSRTASTAKRRLPVPRLQIQASCPSTWTGS